MDRHKQALEKLAHGTVIPATPLALDAERKFDEKRQRALLRYYMDAGVGGIGSRRSYDAVCNPRPGNCTVSACVGVDGAGNGAL